MNTETIDDVGKLVNRKYGFKPEPIISGQDYFGGAHGSLEGVDLNDKGDWRLHLPPFEPQNVNKVETSACTLFGTTSSIETLGKFQYGVELNLSDRFLAKVSGIGREGGSPHAAAEWTRKVGAPEEKDWPFAPDITTWEMYMADLPPKLFDLAKAYFYNQWDFRHEYIENDTKTRKKYLKKSPLGRSVVAWHKDNKGFYYSPEGVPHNHWVEEVFIQDQGYSYENYSVVFDSYLENNEPLKKLRLDHVPIQTKRYQLNKRDPRDLAIQGQVFYQLSLAGLLKHFLDWFQAFSLSTQKPI